jgi:hypothetical protein
MYPKSNIINLNEFQNSVEGKVIETKNIIKLINSQYSNSLKNPFSNSMLRKTIIRHKIKNLNQIKKNLKQKKKEHKKISFKQNNLYINFSDYFEQNKQKSNENNNINNNLNFNNSFDEDNFYKNIRNNYFPSHRKVFRSRNIKPLKLLPPSKTIHNLKYKSYTKEYTDKKIVYINNQIVKINKMNITINNLPKFIRLDDKSIQAVKKLLPKIEESKIYNRLNNKLNNLTCRNNNISKIKTQKTTQIIQYLRNKPNILFKNKTNNEIIKANEDIYKSISAERNNNLYNDYSTHRDKINNFNTNFLSKDLNNRKKNGINIFTLISLKNNGQK